MTDFEEWVRLYLPELNGNQIDMLIRKYTFALGAAINTEDLIAENDRMKQVFKQIVDWGSDEEAN